MILRKGGRLSVNIIIVFLNYNKIIDVNSICVTTIVGIRGTNGH